MITTLRLSNFKSFSHLVLDTHALTLLSGVNSSGKTSILHALLVLRQSHRSRLLWGDPPTLDWGSDDGRSYVRLGTFTDVISDSAPAGTGVRIDLESDQGNTAFETTGYNSDNRHQKTTPGTWTVSNPNWPQMPLFSSRFQYLSSDRISPQEDYPRFEGNLELGRDGRFAPHFLEKFGDSLKVSEALLHPDWAEDRTLRGQMNAWMREISPGVDIKVQENTNTNRVELSYRYLDNKGIPTLDRKPQNVGFGITQTLPTLVALLSAQPGDLLLLENPESHLHPRGQSRLGMLIAKAANAGVQIFAETHSDHILNGIRVAARQKQVSPDMIRIWFFERSLDQSVNARHLHLDANGRIDQWPKGFFDEWDNMLDYLL